MADRGVGAEVLAVHTLDALKPVEDGLVVRLNHRPRGRLPGGEQAAESGQKLADLQRWQSIGIFPLLSKGAHCKQIPTCRNNSPSDPDSAPTTYSSSSDASRHLEHPQAHATREGDSGSRDATSTGITCGIEQQRGLTNINKALHERIEAPTLLSSSFSMGFPPSISTARVTTLSIRV